MENKTAEEMALKKYPYIDGDVYRDAGNTCKREGFYAGYEAASLQCAEMKEENERLKKKINAVIDAVDKSNDEKKQLQEEVERLKRALSSLVLSVKAHPDYQFGQDDDEWHNVVSICDKALSGKESKTDK